MSASEKLKDLQKTQLRKVTDTLEVSYAVLPVSDHDLDATLEKLATTINVQLIQGSELIPFIPFNSYDKVEEEDKSFLYGPSGCGKSRCIYELVKKKLSNFKNIFIINPRQIVGAKVSGRLMLHKLFAEFGQNDVVIWDNFPDDLMETDIQGLENILKDLSLQNVATLLVALKPMYLEIYRNIANRIFELNVQEISYEHEDFKKIIKAYGCNVKQFGEIYMTSILNNTERISKILWHKEPTPLTVLDYYKELVDKSQNIQSKNISAISTSKHENNDRFVESPFFIDAIREAEKLLRPMAYYQRQFNHIISLEERQNDVEFLYTMKLCYELGLSRSISLVEQLRNGIFINDINSSPEMSRTPSDLMFRRLSSWVYLSGQYYAMHDVSKDAIRFNDYVNLKITNYLTENFAKVIHNNEASVNYLFGIYLGRNFQFVPRDSSQSFVPPNIYKYMKNNRYFETGLGLGIAETFLSLNEGLQKEILKRVEVDIEFARGLGDGLGHKFASLDDLGQRQILTQIASGLPFARFLGESLGRVFVDLSPALQDNILIALQDNIID